MLPFPLADLPPPDGPSLTQFIYATAALVVIAYYALGVVGHFKPKPPLHEYVLIKDFNVRMEAMSRTSKEFRDKIREEMSEIGERLVAVETKQDISKEKLDVMDAKLDRLIEKGASHG